MIPENLRALIVVLLLAFPAFSVSRRVVVPDVSAREFATWRTAWFASTIAAFALGNFFLFAAALVGICWWARRSASNNALFVILLFTAPPISVTVGGFGIVNELMQLNHAQLLSVLLLLPTLVSSKMAPTKSTQKSDVDSQRTSIDERNPRSLKVPDTLVILYVLLLVSLEYRNAGFTHVLRMAIIHSVNIAVPYFAFSRAIRGFEDARVVMLAFVTATMPLSLIGLFEMLKGWLLYAPIPTQWGVPLLDSYVAREGFVRAATSAAGPIAFGFLGMVSLGCLLTVHRTGRLSFHSKLAFAILYVGLISNLSRGPWVGAAIMLVVMIATSERRAVYLTRLAIAAICTLPLLFTPIGERALSYLPFVGTVEVENISYREKLIENAMIVVERNLLTGSVDYLTTPEMLEMVQGQGIIDIVNTYLQIALQTGLLGLGLFVLLVAIILFSFARLWSRLRNPIISVNGSFAILVAIVATIATVSSVSFIPYVYWMFFGLSVGLLRIPAASSVNKRQLRAKSKLPVLAERRPS